MIAKTNNNTRADVTSMNALRAAFTSVREALGSVDCLVNAAGIGTGGPLIGHSEETINKIIGINVSLRVLPRPIVRDELQKIEDTSNL